MVYVELLLVCEKPEYQNPFCWLICEQAICKEFGTERRHDTWAIDKSFFAFCDDAAEGITLLLAIIIRCGRNKEHSFDQLEDPAPPDCKKGKTSFAVQKLRTDFRRSKEDGDAESYYERCTIRAY